MVTAANMTSQKKPGRRGLERMSDFSFRGMEFLFRVIDFVHPYIDKRVQRFGIQPGMTVVDYGCGPGRYTTSFAHLVGDRGRVFAVDIHELAIEGVKKRIQKQGLKTVTPVLAKGYDSGIPDGVADVVCAIDIFFGINDPSAFLKELRRVTHPEGFLVIDDGHQSRKKTKRKLAASGYWEVMEESKDHLKCKPLSYA
jgi:ubiquinone/menaquinone biosynthesis C-methylase UbiE